MIRSAQTGEIRPLTGLRAFAAWWIVLYHLRFEVAETFTGVDFVVTRVANIGYLGVDLFFILSGFIISYNYSAAMRPFSISVYLRFLWARLARVYPVHIFTLLVVLLVGTFIRETWFDLAPPGRFAWRAFLENLMLIDAWSVPVFDTWNQPSWSVSAEWFAYCFFPLFLWLSVRANTAAWRIFLVFCTLGGALVVYTMVRFNGALEYGFIRLIIGFFLGCLLFQFFQARAGETLKWEVMVPVVVGIFIILAWINDRPRFSSLLWAPVFFSVIIYGLAWNRGLLARIFSSAPVCYWGRVSYSTYMVHLVCIVVVRGFVSRGEFMELNTFERFGILALDIGVVVIASMVTFHLVEEPARHLMRRVWKPRKIVRGAYSHVLLR